MSNNVNIEVRGLKELEAKMKKLGKDLNSYMTQAALQASKDTLKTVGLQKYPPGTLANQPPVPYYVRGRGMQYKYGNDNKSERLGTQWHIDKDKGGAHVYNRVSYAQYVHGENQASHMAPKGWRKLKEVFAERHEKIRMVFDAWVKKALKETRLK